MVDLINAITDGSWAGGSRPFGISGGGVEDDWEGDPLATTVVLSRVLLSNFRITDFVLDGLFIMPRASPDLPRRRFNIVRDVKRL